MSAQAAASGSWVTMTTLWRSRSTLVRSTSRTWSVEWESRFPVGSSAKMTAGPPMSARAHATRWI